MPNCPCGSNKNESDCCVIFIDGRMQADTPEKLMRSRYTAYTKANIDYIQRTMKAPASNHFNAESAKQWAQTLQWLGLNVIKSTTHSTKGYVEFIAHFNEDGEKKEIHEISEFHQIQGVWYYVDGKHTQPQPAVKMKIGRNDPCACGSGKKYKACCLRNQ